MSFLDLQAQAPRALPRYPQRAISKLIVIERRGCHSTAEVDLSLTHSGDLISWCVIFVLTGLPISKA